uniref:Sarcospan (Kras oncogene-associated gene) n=1 Tax=Paramormyrops kingsleyae TaxID=1676925 RepID=A0A3B3Q2Y4_9TELE|nr:sarcospan [Paramormyrops kingsleyae]
MGMEGSASDESDGEKDGRTCLGCRFPLIIATLQLVLSVTIMTVAFVMVFISPSLMARETPYWAGIIVFLVSILGFVLCCITYLPDERTSMQFIVKVSYFLLCTLGLILSILVIAFSSHHYTLINGFSCQEKGEDCSCTHDPEDPIARTFLYANVSDCSAITGTLKIYFLLQIMLNVAQALVCLSGALIMWMHRYQMFFAGLQIGSPSPRQWKKVNHP